jgi:diacylglycerol O-acyltransferase / wax synthase
MGGAAEVLGELVNVLLLSDDPPSRFKGDIGVRKHTSWTSPIPLEEVKAVGKALGCTVNDVLISVMTGALHRYLVQYGDDPSACACVRPCRSTCARWSMRENWAITSAWFSRTAGGRTQSAGASLPGRRLHARSQALQAGDDVAGTAGLLGMGPAAVQKPALELFSRKASTVLTNVPDPQQPLYLAGAKIRELMCWVPQTGSVGMGISIISYNGQVYCGLITDNRLVPDPETVMENFQTEFRNLLHLTMLIGPQDGPVDPSVAEMMHEWIDGDGDGET